VKDSELRIPTSHIPGSGKKQRKSGRKQGPETQPSASSVAYCNKQWQRKNMVW
jgi:hypothetical protein